MPALASQIHAAEPSVAFNRDIRPILAENCFNCHGPDPAARKASLRLDREDGFFGKREDGPTVIKGNPDESPLFQRLINHGSRRDHAAAEVASHAQAAADRRSEELDRRGRALAGALVVHQA